MNSNNIYHPQPGRPQQFRSPQQPGPPGPRQGPQSYRPTISNPIVNQPSHQAMAMQRMPGPHSPGGPPVGPNGPGPGQNFQNLSSGPGSAPRYANRLAKGRHQMYSNSGSNRTGQFNSQRSTRTSGSRKKNSGLCPGCDCNFNTKYAMSMQGLCKALQILCLLVTWSVIASTPYWRRYFIIDGYTWPFHIVMLLTIGLWIVTLGLYVMFLLGWHFSYRSIAWPGVELWFNLIGLVAMILAGSLQTAHVWRWDYRNGLPLQSQMPVGFSNNRGSGYTGGIGNLGLSGGLGGASLCGGYGRGYSSYGGSSTQRDCMELLQAMAGINVYFGHHVFATIFLWIIVLEFLVSTYLAWKMFKKFEHTFETDMQSQRGPGMSIYDNPESCGNCWNFFKDDVGGLARGMDSFRDSKKKLLSASKNGPGQFRDDDTIKDAVFDDDIGSSRSGKKKKKWNSSSSKGKKHKGRPGAAGPSPGRPGGPSNNNPYNQPQIGYI